MAQTKFDICNRALTRVGASRISSFDDGSAEAIACAEDYEPLARHHLAAHRWRFATDQRLLVRREETPEDARWQYAWQLPAETLTLHGVTRFGRPVEYDRFGETIFADADEGLVATYTFRADESRWQPNFVEAFTEALASRFALTLPRDKPLADALDANSRGLFGVARGTDSQQQTARRLPVGRLIAVRR